MGKSRKDYEKYLNSISPDRDDEPRFRGDAGCITWRKATVDEIIEHFKNR